MWAQTLGCPHRAHATTPCRAAAAAAALVVAPHAAAVAAAAREVRAAAGGRGVTLVAMHAWLSARACGAAQASRWSLRALVGNPPQCMCLPEGFHTKFLLPCASSAAVDAAPLPCSLPGSNKGPGRGGPWWNDPTYWIGLLLGVGLAYPLINRFILSNTTDKAKVGARAGGYPRQALAGCHATPQPPAMMVLT